jgi:ubiquinone/menaquinone biosynthesis C-methylase UbiE
MYENWQLWGTKPELESKFNIERLKGNLSDMESTKQLSNLISDCYEPGMKILDVGCNVGHYLLGLRKNFPTLDYTGVDAYTDYINEAKKAFSSDINAHFEVRDIFKPILPDTKFDIVYCCNVLLHLPDFKIPITNLLNNTKKICFIRTLISDHTSIVKSPLVDIYDENGEPKEFWYFNTWNKDHIDNFIKGLGWKTEYIKDEFIPENIQKEFSQSKTGQFDKGTRILGDKQIVDNIIFNWVWIKIFK